MSHQPIIQAMLVLYYLCPGKMTTLSMFSGKASNIFPTFESNFLITSTVSQSTWASNSYTHCVTKMTISTVLRNYQSHFINQQMFNSP